MTKIEKQHKDEVEKLKAMEDELSDLILKTENLHLMTAFNDWHEQRNVCNSIYNEWLAETLKSVSVAKRKFCTRGLTWNNCEIWTKGNSCDSTCEHYKQNVKVLGFIFND